MQVIDTSNWKTDENGWSVAPEGLDWIKAGTLARIGEGASIGEGAYISDYATIGKGVHISDYARIGEYVSIGEGARISKYAYIGEGARIGAGALIGEGACIGEYAYIGEGAENPIDLGTVAGHRVCAASVKGAAYVGVDCKWMTLADALRSEYADGPAQQAILTYAKIRAEMAGWRTE